METKEDRFLTSDKVVDELKKIIDIPPGTVALTLHLRHRELAQLKLEVIARPGTGELTTRKYKLVEDGKAPAVCQECNNYNDQDRCPADCEEELRESGE